MTVKTKPEAAGSALHAVRAFNNDRSNSQISDEHSIMGKVRKPSIDNKSEEDAEPQTRSSSFVSKADESNTNVNSGISSATSNYLIPTSSNTPESEALSFKQLEERRFIPKPPEEGLSSPIRGANPRGRSVNNISSRKTKEPNPVTRNDAIRLKKQEEQKRREAEVKRDLLYPSYPAETNRDYIKSIAKTEVADFNKYSIEDKKEILVYLAKTMLDYETPERLERTIDLCQDEDFLKSL